MMMMMSQLPHLAVLVLVLVAMAAAQSLSDCPNKCGNVSIPYPFGVGDKCFYQSEKSFNVTCENNSKPLLYGNTQVLNISLEGKMDINMYASRLCHNQTGGVVDNDLSFLRTAAFTISSSENKFVTVGCDSYGYLNSIINNQNYSTGCLTRCNTLPNGTNSDDCSGIGCCQVDIPSGMRNISFQAFSFNKHSQVLDFNNCTYAFVAKQGSFHFSLDYLEYFPNNMSQMVVEWNIPGNCTTQPLPCNLNSHCNNSDDGLGYSCICNTGYRGNPYHPDGCNLDIDECSEKTHNCTSQKYCENTPPGSFLCVCPSGYHGNPYGPDGGCQQGNLLIKILFGACAGLVALFVSLSWLYLVYQKRKLIKLKKTFFRRNGGFLLLQQLSVKEGPSQAAKIFTTEELRKATNNYHDSLIIGKGGYGTVYKGLLTDNTIVAIKKSKLVDRTQIEQFINEVVVLSQINHRNVVKLLGCCLETEVPLLVYEFVNNGTLFDFIHNKSNVSKASWDSRLRIAAETAGALAYLHSAASIPIIHRDVKPSNILLDDSYTVKVSDFGASRLIPLDQAELATMVQGTLGYLDPEYMQTNQLTEKSDVYSFGVVLVELLTGEKALSFDRPENERCLAMRFLSSLKQGRLMEVVEEGIVNDENKEMVKEVCELAGRCLRLQGEERPSMKEVAMEIEGMRMTGKHAWVSKDHNLEETQSLLGKTSGISEYGDSIRDHVLISLEDGR